MVSVIIPVYNRINTLRRCVESLLNQTYKDIEIILVDDESTDSTDVLCDELSKEDSRVKSMHVEGDGVADTRNRGIAVAQGEYLTFVDSDDYVAPDYIEKLLAAINEEGCIMAMCNCIDVRGGGRKECIFPGNGKREIKAFLEDTMYCRANGGTCWAKIYKRDLVKHMFRKYNYNEDLFFVFDYLLECELSGESAYINMVPDCLYYYSPVDNSISVVKTTSDLMDVINVCLAIKDICKEKCHDILAFSEALLLNNAFFSYLNSKSDKSSDGVSLREKAVSVIKEYRGKVIKDKKATFKTRMACFMSYISMGLLSCFYGMIK